MHRPSALTATTRQLLGQLTPWLPQPRSASIWEAVDNASAVDGLRQCWAAVEQEGMPLSEWEHHWMVELTAYMATADAPGDLAERQWFSNVELRTHSALVAKRLKGRLGAQHACFTDACADAEFQWAIDNLLAYIDKHHIAIDSTERNLIRGLWLQSTQPSWVPRQLHVQEPPHALLRAEGARRWGLAPS